MRALIVLQALTALGCLAVAVGGVLLWQDVRELERPGELLEITRSPEARRLMAADRERLAVGRRTPGRPYPGVLLADLPILVRDR